MSTLATSKAWQRQRALALHNAFQAAARRMQAEGLTIAKTLDQLLATLHGTTVRFNGPSGTDLKPLKISRGSLKDNWYRWTKPGIHQHKPESLLLDYNPGHGPSCKGAMPAALIAELHRRATLPGMAHISVVEKSLRDDWKAGRTIPGLGDWQTWYANKYGPDALQQLLNGPTGTVPEFPFSSSTFYKHQPSKKERALGNKGFAAFRNSSAYVSLNYSKLRKCELFVLDDVRLDLIVIDESTGQPIELKGYIMMEAGSRYIVGYVLKPANAIKQEDVDELIAYSLSAAGIGRDYTTHIKLERGTVAMSEAAQTLLEAATHGRIKIHRTSMDGGVRWIGSPRDKASGHWAGKAVIESFMRKLHLALMHLPAQRGNKFENQPANLGLEGFTAKGPSLTPGSLLAEAQKLATFQLTINQGRSENVRLRLSLPMLYLYQLETIFRDAIKRHNTEPGHNYQGHGTFREAEVQPGVWQRTNL